MRHDIDTYLDSIIYDDKEYILEDAAAEPTRTIAEWEWLSIESGEFYVEFFDASELENDGPSAEQVQELRDYIYKYYNIPSLSYFADDDNE